MCRMLVLWMETYGGWEVLACDRILWKRCLSWSATEDDRKWHGEMEVKGQFVGVKLTQQSILRIWTKLPLTDEFVSHQQAGKQANARLSNLVKGLRLTKTHFLQITLSFQYLPELQIIWDSPFAPDNHCFVIYRWEGRRFSRNSAHHTWSKKADDRKTAKIKKITIVASNLHHD